MVKIIQPKEYICGTYTVPPDKSVSHRTIILGSLAEGVSRASNFLYSEDCIQTLNIFRAMGVEVVEDGAGGIEIHGVGYKGLQEPKDILYAGNSGTTIRLITGVLAGTDFLSIITGDDSLRKRPMDRIITPLSLMGAQIWGKQKDKYPPLAIKGTRLKGIEYKMPMASAQVKSAILLAGLQAEGKLIIEEPAPSRDHTERMLSAMGADIQVEGNKIILNPGNPIKPFETAIPGDISSAAFIIGAAALLDGSCITIEDVGLNPRRTGFIQVLQRMGAHIQILNYKTSTTGEPYGDIMVQSGTLKGVHVVGEDIPLLIDEIPMLALLATKAHGRTVVSGAKELRIKESDRLSAVVKNLRLMGIQIEESEDGFSLEGPQQLKGAPLDAFGDHRIAMTFAIAGLSAKGETRIFGAESVSISFPSFWDLGFFPVVQEEEKNDDALEFTDDDHHWQGGTRRGIEGD